MRHLCRVFALALVLAAAAPTLAVAGLGEYHTLIGPITLWGPNRFGQQIAVVQDDEGRRWVVRFDQDTLPPGAAVGTEMTILGRETALGELDVMAAHLSSSVSALPTAAASGWAVVPGSVQDASGTTAVLRANGGVVVTVDMSELDADARTWLTPGRPVTVVGVYRADGVLAARGVATSAP